MKLDRPNPNEIERLMSPLVFHDDFFLPNVSLQEFGLCFQSLAGKQVDLLDVGKEYSKRTNHVYVLCREKIVIEKKLTVNTSYTLVTYPLTPGRLQMQREAYLLDEKDEVVLKVDSIWVLVDYVSRRMVRTNDVYQAQAKYPRFNTFEPLFTEKLETIEDYELYDFEKVFEHKVDDSDLDANDHMNNTVYLKLVQPFVSGNIQSVEIDFEKECRKDDTLEIYRRKTENAAFFIGMKEDRKLSFKIKIILE